MGFSLITEIFVVNEKCPHNQQKLTQVCLWSFWMLKLIAIIATKVYLKYHKLKEKAKERERNDQTQSTTRIIKSKTEKVWTFICSGFKDEDVEVLYKVQPNQKYQILARIQQFVFCRRFLIGLILDLLHLLFMLISLHEISPDGKLGFKKEDKYLPSDGLIAVCLMSLIGTILKCYLTKKHKDGTIVELYGVLAFKSIEMFIEFVYFDRNLNSPDEWTLSFFALIISVLDLMVFVVDVKIDFKLLTNFANSACKKTKAFQRFCKQEIKFGLFLANIAPFCIELFKFAFYLVTVIEIVVNRHATENIGRMFEEGVYSSVQQYIDDEFGMEYQMTDTNIMMALSVLTDGVPWAEHESVVRGINGFSAEWNLAPHSTATAQLQHSHSS